MFVHLARAYCQQRGLPQQRLAFVPMPVMGKTPAQLREYVDGADPISGRPFMDEVLEGLTKPIAEAEQKQVVFERTTPRLVEPDTEENLHQHFMDNRWTDYLPIVLPTEERVADMLSGTSHSPDEVVGTLRPTSIREGWQFTVEKVAVNAVMSGARKEYFPVILALAASGVSARRSTSSSAGTMVVVNGPIRQEIEMNCGIGAMGPYNHANSTIGRAFGLFSQNLQGGSVPGVTYLGSQGNNYAYNNTTFAENEERSPWVPFHVQHGFKPTDSVVSAFHGVKSTSFLLGVREKFWREHVQNLLRGMNPNIPPTLVLDPITAQQFVDRGGFDTKEKLIDWIYENATMRAEIYWDYQLVENYVYPRALKGMEPHATHLKAADDDMIKMYIKDKIHVVVVGGETNGYWRMMGCNYGGSVSVDEWR